MFVGDDGACAGATDGWPFGEVRVVYGREVLRCAQNDIWGLVPVCAGKTVWWVAVFAADDGVGAVPMPHLFQLITQNGVLFVENVGCHDHLAGHARPIPCCFDADAV